MSSAVKRAGAGGWRYAVVKAASAVEEAMSEPARDWGSFLQRFQDAYGKQLTTTIAIAGVAMAPSLNKAALDDANAFERLVVRLIPRASPRNVAVGDVVAFTSPLDKSAMMVRRVAALENEQMVSDDADEASFAIPANHCWVLADNAGLAPPDVIDSRVFGYIPMDSIMGRIIYRIAGPDQHGAVQNSPAAVGIDGPVIEQEVDVPSLLGGTPAAEEGGSSSSSSEGSSK